jgi:hypothetical protein
VQRYDKDFSYDEEKEAEKRANNQSMTLNQLVSGLSYPIKGEKL